MNPDLIGYLAGVAMAISLSPQVIKVWKTRSARDISLAWVIIYVIGLSLWVLYGILIQALPMMIFSSVELAFALALLALKLFRA
jgi:MtN3 and saliva related transmembrane protein